jgi:hypothetical protein
MREDIRANPPRKPVENPERLPETETLPALPGISSTTNTKGSHAMYGDFIPEMSKVRQAEYRAEAEQRKLEKLARGEEHLSLRAKAARRLFDAAFALEAEESWRAVWDRMSGKERRRERRLFGRKYAN